MICPNTVSGNIELVDEEALKPFGFIPAKSKNPDEKWANSTYRQGFVQLRHNINKATCTMHYNGAPTEIIYGTFEDVLTKQLGFTSITSGSIDKSPGSVFEKAGKTPGKIDRFTLVATPSTKTTSVQFSQRDAR